MCYLCKVGVALLVILNSLVRLSAQDKIQVLVQKGYTKNSSAFGYDLKAISPDNKWVITQNYNSLNNQNNPLNHEVTVWNLPTSKIYARYPFSVDIEDAVVLPDNENVLINKTWVLNIHSGQVSKRTPVTNLKYQLSDTWSSECNAFEYSLRIVEPDSIGFLDSLIEEYDHYDDYDPKIYCVKGVIFWGAKDGRVYKYEINTRIVMDVFEPKIGKINDLIFIDNKETLITVGSEATCFYNTKTNERITIPGTLSNVRVNDQLTYVSALVNGSTNDEVQVWSLNKTPASVYSILIENLQGPSIANFVNDTTILVGIEDKPLQLIDIRKRIVLWEDKAAYSSYEFISNKRFVLIEHDDPETTAIYEISSMNNLVACIKGGRDVVMRSVKISPDAQFIACYEKNNINWDIGFSIYRTDNCQQVATTYIDTVERYLGTTARFLFTPKSNEILYYSGKITFRYNIIQNSLQRTRLEVPIDGFNVKYTKDGHFLVDYHFSQKTKIYEAESLNPLTSDDQEVVRLRSTSGDMICVLENKSGQDYTAKFCSTLEQTEVQFKLGDYVHSFNIDPTATQFAYVCDEYEHTLPFEKKTWLKIVELNSCKVTDSVVLPASLNAVDGNLIFNRERNTIYVGVDALYEYKLLSHQLRRLTNHDRQQFTPLNVSFNGKYLFGFVESKKGMQLVGLNLIKGSKDFAHEVKYSFIDMTSLSNSWVKKYPEVLDCDNNQYLVLWDESPTLREVNPESYLFDPKQHQFTSEHSYYIDMLPDGSMEVFDVPSFNSLKIISPYEYVPVNFTSDLKYAFADGDGVAGSWLKIFDVQKGFRKVPFIETKGKEGYFYFFGDNRVYFGEQMRLSSKGKYLAVLNSSDTGFIKVFSFAPEKGQTEPTHQLVFAMYDPSLLNADVVSNLFLSELHLTEDENYFVCPTYKNYLIRGDISKKTFTKLMYSSLPHAEIFRASASQTGKWVTAYVAESKHALIADFVVWDADGSCRILESGIDIFDIYKREVVFFEKLNLIMVKKISGLAFVDLITSTTVYDVFDPEINNYEADSNSVVIYSKFTGKKKYLLPTFKLDIAASNEHHYYFSSDNTFQYVMQDTTVVAKFLFDNTNDQLLWFTNSNYYFVNKESRNAVAFRFRNDVYPVSAFDALFNRPDTIFKLLAPVFHFSNDLIRLYHDAYRQRSTPLQIKQDLAQYLNQLPTVTINTLGQGLITIETEYEVEIHSGDAKYCKIKVNGVPLFGAKGKTVETTQTWRERVPLLPGDNTLEVTVVNQNGIESLPSTIVVNRKDSKPISGRTYFIGIGVSKFKYNPEKNLNFSSKDILDIASLLGSRKDCQVLATMLDSGATKDKVMELRATLLTKTKPEDKVILCFSGHGVVKDGRYFLSTYDMKFDKPDELGLDIEDVYRLLDSIPARNKLIILDACRSGRHYSTRSSSNVVVLTGSSTPSIEDIMENVFSDFNNAYGIDVVAATSSNAAAIEPFDLKNSFLCSAVIDAIKSNLDDTVEPGEIPIKEFKNYISSRVFMLTGGYQIPSIRNENLSNDWKF